MICTSSMIPGAVLDRPMNMFSDELEKDVLQVCRMMAEPARMKILMLLTREQQLHVSAFCQRMKQSQPAVSHHLALMKDAGMLEMRKEGKHNFYSLTPPMLNLLGQLFKVVEDVRLTPVDPASPPPASDRFE